MRDGAHSETPDVLIVGAGIVGVTAAARLIQAGLSVTVVDRSGACEETSSGNAAALAFSDILPLAHKGMLRRLPGWLADPLGPFAIPPAYLPRLMPWLIRFLKAGSPVAREDSLSAQAGLMRLAQAEWLDLMQVTGTRSLLRENGALELYEGPAQFRASLSSWALRDRFGIPWRAVRGQELADLQPGLSPRFTDAVFVPDWKTVGDPKVLGQTIWAHAERSGARLIQGLAVAIEADGDGATVTLEGGRVIRGLKLVLAAGAWSHRLAAGLGDFIPLETERGYNTTLPRSAFDMRRMLIFPGHGFVVSPLDQGVRVGGAVELGGLERPPDWRRARAMLNKAQAFLPGLDPTDGREWMGYRPSLPDSLPVIGRAPDRPQIVYAFGHGHLGLTQAAATARLVRDLILDQPTALDLAPFSPTRF